MKITLYYILHNTRIVIIVKATYGRKFQRRDFTIVDEKKNRNKKINFFVLDKFIRVHTPL